MSAKRADVYLYFRKTFSSLKGFHFSCINRDWDLRSLGTFLGVGGFFVEDSKEKRDK